MNEPESHIRIAIAALLTFAHILNGDGVYAVKLGTKEAEELLDKLKEKSR